MSNFKIYLEKAQGKKIDINEIVSVNENFRNYMQKIYRIDEFNTNTTKTAPSTKATVARTETPIEKFQNRLTKASNKLFLDFMVYMNTKKLDISLKDISQLSSSNTGNNFQIDINNETFKIYKNNILCKTLEEALKDNSQNVVNLKQKSDNMIFELSSKKAQDYIRLFFLKRYGFSVNFMNFPGDLKIKNSEIELCITKVELDDSTENSAIVTLEYYKKINDTV